MAAQPRLTYTPVEEIGGIVERLRASFEAGRTQSLDWRKRQLQGISQLVKDNATVIAKAVQADLRRPVFESVLCEVTGVVAEAKFALANIDSWVSPSSVSMPLTMRPGSSEIVADPYGVVLLIGPWNFPVSLILQPLISAIAAGNVVVIKPSEVASHTAVLLERLILKYVDNDVVGVVQGAVPETTELLRHKFDHIFYTGNGAVGRIVMSAAAKHLTSVTLELGGKSPCIVDNTHGDFGVVARRIWAGKLLNCGQVCVAPDYVLVTRDAHDRLLKALKETVVQFYGENIQRSKHLGRIINERHFDRVCALLDSHKGQVIRGGHTDRDDLFIEPTLLGDVDLNSKIMQEEIFGPVLPIVPVDNLEHAVRIVRGRDKPLALYLFSKSDAAKKYVLGNTSSGGVCINDTIMHLANPNLPFGGVGPSGTGSYHGIHGFRAFSHERSVMTRGTWLDPAMRYPPYTDRKLQMANMILDGVKIPKPVLLLAAAAGTAATYYALRSKL